MPPYYFRQNQQYQFNPYQQQYPSMQERYEVIPVSSIEEAKNAIISPLCSYFFLDVNTSNIYFKKMTNNGTSQFIIYSPQEQKTQQTSDPIVEINERLKVIEYKISNIGGYDAKSVSNVPKPESNNGTEFTTADEFNDSTESDALSKSPRNDSRKK